MCCFFVHADAKLKKRPLAHKNCPVCQSMSACVCPSDGLVVVGVHSAKFPNEKVSVFTTLCYLAFFKVI